MVCLEKDDFELGYLMYISQKLMRFLASVHWKILRETTSFQVCLPHVSLGFGLTLV